MCADQVSLDLLALVLLVTVVDEREAEQTTLSLVDADSTNYFQLLVVSRALGFHTDLHPAGGWGAGARASA